MIPRRSSLSVPGNNMKMMAKAAGSAADVLVLDLEDAVPLSEKEVARDRIREALGSLDFGAKEVAVRINGLKTPFAEGDLAMAVEAGADAVVVPKAEEVEGLHWVDSLLSRMEASLNPEKKTSVQLLIESARGVQLVDEMSRSSGRITALIFGIGDYLSDIEAKVSNLGEAAPICLYPRSRIVIAAAARGLDAIDSVYPDFRDAEGLEAEARRGLAMGFKGKWVIHPSQIEVVNEVFSPSLAELQKARSTIEAYEKAQAEGIGVIVVDNQMVDEATIRIAVKQCQLAKRLGLWEKING